MVKHGSSKETDWAGRGLSKAPRPQAGKSYFPSKRKRVKNTDLAKTETSVRSHERVQGATQLATGVSPSVPRAMRCENRELDCLEQSSGALKWPETSRRHSQKIIPKLLTERS